jgi:glycosyltransferase involved in cell wall biosynthesis
MPIISIITINYNNASGLQKTMQSVLDQTCPEFEYIVVDGASTDDSISLIQTCKLSNFQTFRWISEPDSGIYNAMNKGIRMATGDYLLFLNSGDWLASNDVVEQVIPYLSADNEIVSGELELVKSKLDKIKLYPPKAINLNYCISEGLTHPNTFIKRELFDKYGYYNEQNKIVSDWEFFLIACGLNKCKFIAIPVLISCFGMDGVSSQNEALLKQETNEALKRLLPKWKKIGRFLKRI